MRAGLALLLLLSTMLGGNCQDTDSTQGEQASISSAMTTTHMWYIITQNIYCLGLINTSKLKISRDQERQKK